MPFGQVAFSIVGIIVIIAAAYWATYYISKKASGKTGLKLRGRNIRLLERFAISKDKSFCAVEIAGKVYIVGITNQSMTLLDTVDAKEYAGSEPESAQDRQMWANVPGGAFGGRVVNKMASFIAGKMGKPNPSGGGGGEPRSGSFADSMKAADNRAESADGGGGESRSSGDSEDGV